MNIFVVAKLKIEGYSKGLRQTTTMFSVEMKIYHFVKIHDIVYIVIQDCPRERYCRSCGTKKIINN